MADRRGTQLCIAGGYDRRVRENVEHLQELKQEARRLHIDDEVVFLTSISNDLRIALLQRALAVLYTPRNEHFGIVPCEAMHLGTVVICDDSGGPRESVIPEAGFRCEGTFAPAMERVLRMSARERASMGEKGRQNVAKRFSLRKFSEHLGQLACL